MLGKGRDGKLFILGGRTTDLVPCAALQSRAFERRRQGRSG